MKQLLCLLLCLSLTPLICGCDSGSQAQVDFYYCRSPEAFTYFEEDGVILTEERDLTGHRGDLRYMLGLYLAGPSTEGARCPFPADTRVLSARKLGNDVHIELSDAGLRLSDSEFTLGCACISLTCIHFTPCDEVTITSGERTITMNRQNLIVFDESAPPAEPVEDPS